MSNTRIYSWSVVGVLADPYKAPEQAAQCLRGRVYGHPQFADGLEITSSSIVNLDISNRTCQTYSGTVYELMDPDPKYVEWLSDNGYSVKGVDN